MADRAPRRAGLARLWSRGERSTLLGKRSSGALARIERVVDELIPGILMLGMSLGVAYGVFARRVLGQPVSWINELAIVLSAWVVLLGASAATRQGLHVGIDYLVIRLPTRWQAATRALTSLVSAAVMIVIAWLGYRFALESGARLQALDVSKRYLLAALPVGAGLMAMQLLKQAVVAARSVRDPRLGGMDDRRGEDDDVGGETLGWGD